MNCKDIFFFFSSLEWARWIGGGREGTRRGYFISLWTPFDIILHSLPGNPNYFAISLKLRLMSLTGTFTREKILSRLNVFLHFSGLPDCAPSEPFLPLSPSPAYYRRKNSRYLIPRREAATRFSRLFFSFFARRAAIKINPFSQNHPSVEKNNRYKSRY